MSLKKKVVIVGDVYADWILARIRTPGSAADDGALFDTRRHVFAYRQLSGPPLLGEIIERTIDPDNADVIRFDPGKSATSSLQPSPYSHTYFLASQFPHTQARWENNEDWVWRIEEEFGVQAPAVPHLPLYTPPPEELNSADLLITDAGHNESEKSIVAMFDHVNAKAKLLVKLTRPSFGDSDRLLTHAVDRFGDRLVVVVTVDELRRIGMRIKGDLSWECTVDDLIRELLDLDLRKRCRHFVVSLYNEGALVFSRQRDGNTRVMLHFDPRSMDRAWPDRIPGTMRGYTHCLLAGVAVKMLTQRSDVIAQGLRAGLEAARVLHRDGLFESPERIEGSSFPRELAFPTDRVADILQRRLIMPRKPDATFRAHIVRAGRAAPSSLPPSDWTILYDRCTDEGDILGRARRIIEWGAGDVEWDFPIARFDDLVVVDRKEIDSLLSIRSLIGGYVRSSERAAPLSIAVFGYPGTGKSFTINSIAKSLTEGRSHRDLTFNLSQFSAPGQIYDALHQVRDEALTGQVPLVFWDEFDSRYGDTKLGWLRYFLAPMQDGTFQEEVVTHNIGRAIFVFAGGTEVSMENFTKSVQENVSVKGPDFLSRLHGFVDIQSLDISEEMLPGVVLRRAFLLRTFIRKSAKHLAYYVEPPVEDHGVELDVSLLRDSRDASQVWPPVSDSGNGRTLKEHINVDPGVVNAFMRITRFKYGARSMEAIVKMSSFKGKEIFDASSLPSSEQLALHVDDAEAFLRLARGPLT